MHDLVTRHRTVTQGRKHWYVVAVKLACFWAADGDQPHLFVVVYAQNEPWWLVVIKEPSFRMPNYEREFFVLTLCQVGAGLYEERLRRRVVMWSPAGRGSTMDDIHLFLPLSL